MLDPYSDYVGVNISLNNSSVSFLNVYAHSICSSSTDRRADSFSPREISSFWETSIAITPSGTQEVLPTPARWKYSTGSSPLTSSPSMTLTHPLFSIAPPLTSLFPLLILVFLAPGRCFRTWVLTTSEFFSSTYRPNERPSSFNFQKARWNGFASNLDSHCPSADEYSSLSLSSATAFFTSLALNAAKSSIPSGRIKRHSKA